MFNDSRGITPLWEASRASSPARETLTWSVVVVGSREARTSQSGSQSEEERFKVFFWRTFVCSSLFILILILILTMFHAGMSWTLLKTRKRGSRKWADRPKPARKAWSFDLPCSAEKFGPFSDLFISWRLVLKRGCHDQCMGQKHPCPAGSSCWVLDKAGIWLNQIRSVLNLPTSGFG
ncbi:hypothetical protein BKA65DRAFT_502747 [Rhexocercosporidium sp. MPI-PUGE-AT-0058]|nr:hypothetical protein BKA65DRAFT_502747 [Rhexocercosporidium sp. MPI-PUGE-AT-0058]